MGDDLELEPDWERIESDYRAGILSLREIAAMHVGVNHVAIVMLALGALFGMNFGGLG